MHFNIYWLAVKSKNLAETAFAEHFEKGEVREGDTRLLGLAGVEIAVTTTTGASSSVDNTIVAG